MTHLMRLIKGISFFAVVVIVFILGFMSFSFAFSNVFFGWLLAGVIAISFCYFIGAAMEEGLDWESDDED